jgi:hypothetical protein
LQKTEQNIRPNLGDIMKNLEHPYYEKEYRPTEVQSLASILPKPSNIYEMTNAEILGDKKRGTDLDQKPTLYSTVVTSHATSVIHPSIPIGLKNIITDSAVADQFAAKRLAPGQMELPTKLVELDYFNDRNFRNLEKPVFLHTGQKSTTDSESLSPLLGVKLGNTVVKAAVNDAKKIKERLKNLRAAERTKKLKALQNARSQIVKESKHIKKELLAETNSLLAAKSASLSLSAILKRYQKRLEGDKLAKLKLTDRVEVKNQLKDKLIKEIEGFRTSPAAYKELLKVERGSIDNIVKQIKSKLHYD